MTCVKVEVGVGKGAGALTCPEPEILKNGRLPDKEENGDKVTGKL